MKIIEEQIVSKPKDYITLKPMDDVQFMLDAKEGIFEVINNTLKKKFRIQLIEVEYE